MHSRFLPAIAFLAIGAVAFAQGEGAKRGKASATVDGKEVSIDYGRPELNGRSVKELTAKLPKDRMWRAGMNQVTVLETGAALMIGGKKVPAGKYSVYVHAPEKGDWELVLNSVLGQPLEKIWAEAPENLAKEPWPHFKYSEEIADQEVVRAKLEKGQVNPPVDLFTIDLKSAGDGAKMMISWGPASWTADLKPAK
jgi:hypothetical protein